MKTGFPVLLLFLGLAVPFSYAADPAKLLIIGQGPDGHKPGTHEFLPGARVVEHLARPLKGIQTTVVRADEPWEPGPALIDEADGIVLLVTQGSRWMQWNEPRWAALRRFAGRGGGLVALHWSVGAKDPQYIPGQLNLLGGTRGGPQRKYTVTRTAVRPVRPDHPVLAGIPPFTVEDEFYYRLDLKPDIIPLLEVTLEDHPETVAWAWERPDGGRSVGFVMLHFHANWEREDYRRFVVQSMLWTLKQKPPLQLQLEVPAALLQPPSNDPKK